MTKDLGFLLEMLFREHLITTFYGSDGYILVAVELLPMCFSRTQALRSLALAGRSTCRWLTEFPWPSPKSYRLIV